MSGARPLKLGVVDQSPVPHGLDARDAVAETVALARLCDELGYHRYWLAEHHSTNSFAGSAPEVLIPVVAGATERIRVGSGGVMLPHYSPYKVAEQFRMLQTLYPARIDLGLGRAPAGTGAAAAALRWGRPAIPVERFPDQVRDLLGWLGESFGDDHPFRRVRATPRGRDLPEPWMLGSGGSTAGVAAELGLGYAFAQFISGLDGADAVRRYREAFRPSDAFAEPRALVAVGVLCADTREEAERLALSLHLWRMRIIRGEDRGIPSPDEAEAAFREAGIPLEELRGDGRSLVGSPSEVAAGVRRLADHYGVDEVMTVTVTHDPAARRRSYVLLAEAMGLSTSPSAPPPSVPGGPPR